MADTITTSLSVTYQGDHLTELFLKPILATEDYLRRFRVIPDVVGKKNIYFRGRAAKIMKKILDCSFTPKGNIAITNKIIQTQDVGVQLKECWNTFKDTVFEKAWLKRGIDKHDLTGTEVEKLFREFIIEGMQRDIARTTWFAKSTSLSEDWNWFDGWFSCFITNSGDLGKKLNISDYESANVLDPDATIDVMGALIKGAPSVLWQLGRQNLRWYMSRGAFHNYEESLRGTVATDSAFSVLVNGIASPAFNGIPIDVLPEWDEDLADANNPWVSSMSTTSKNVILLTTPMNLVIGIDGFNVQNNSAKVWYSMDNDDLRARVNMMLGTQCMLLELFAIAY